MRARVATMCLVGALIALTGCADDGRTSSAGGEPPVRAVRDTAGMPDETIVTLRVYVFADRTRLGQLCDVLQREPEPHCVGPTLRVVHLPRENAKQLTQDREWSYSMTPWVIRGRLMSGTLVVSDVHIP